MRVGGTEAVAGAWSFVMLTGDTRETSGLLVTSAASVPLEGSPIEEVALLGDELGYPVWV